ncbi:SCO6880 family protein [Nocardia bhagyanarayanae]|uniref:PrgI family protein n=1 Tax=Nocardia bhagyanarayanae TaxID=1215925 RepID=A0A543FFX6_9NOCA|nr:SCO6880 family protein [Nocardia bhagyanarayanae]TQM32681.1 hypothetical protein FB390_4376 [Nocardia bhagyanarayanae]
MSTRMYGRWEKPRSAGFFGLTWGVSMLGLGLIVAIMVAFMVWQSLSVAGAVAVAAAVVFVPMAVTYRGRTGWELVALHGQYALARAAGETIYRAGRFSRLPGRAKLPGLLADSRLSEYETAGGRRFAMLHIRRSDHYAVVLRVMPRGQELVDQSAIDTWVEEYGHFLAAQSRSGEVVAVTAVLESVVETRLRQQREVTELVRRDAPDYAQAVMREAAADTGGSGVRVEARIAVTYRPIGRGRIRRDEAEQAREIGRRLQTVVSQLARAGLPATPMRAGELMALVRSRYDLASQRDVELAGESITDTQSWGSVGPVAHEDRWDHLIHDGGRSITWEMDGAPRGAVNERVLDELLRPRLDVPRKRVAIFYRLHSAAEATTLVDNDFRDAIAAEQTERGIASASARIRVTNTQASREEQARGAGLTRVGLLVTVTDRLNADMPGIEASLRGMTAASRLGVRRCYATQASTFAASLGIGVVLPEHASIPKRVTA